MSKSLLSTVNVAVIGAGYWGENLVRNFHKLGALRAICDTAPDRVAHFKTQYTDCLYFDNFDTLLKDPSLHAVVIATPAEHHASLVKKALLAGKDVFVEKPLSLTVESGKGLVALARQKNRILMVGHLLWYHPAVLRLKELVDAGELGRIQYIYSNRLNLGRIRREENILWSFAPHDISVILGLLNEMPKTIIAQGGNYLNSKIADVTISCLAFSSGIRAHIFVSWLHPFKEQKLVIIGDKKMAVFDDMNPDSKLLLYPHSIEKRKHITIAERAEAQKVTISSEEPLQEECRHFLDCVSHRTPPRTDGEEGLRVLRVLERCQKAMDATDPLEIPVAPASRTDASSLPPSSFTAHESTVIDPNVEIGKGTTIWHFSHILEGSHIGAGCRIGQNVVIGPRAQVGHHVKIQNNVSVYEGVTLEDYVFCGPSMVFTNVLNPRSEIPRMNELKKTLVKHGATLGANSTVICGVQVGRYAFVGAGAVVTKDVPDYALVMGNPAKQRGWMCQCGIKLNRLRGLMTCTHCRTTYRVQGKSGLQPVKKSR